MKRLLLLCGLVLMVAIGSGQYTKFVDTYKISVSIDETADTAKLVRMHTITAIDSFHYVDSIFYNADTTDHVVIDWLSPLQVMIITPQNTDSSTVYACSVGFASDTLGFTVDPGDYVGTSDSELVDTLVYLFNNTTDLKDSVLAQDSVTYVKLVSKFGYKTFGARWKVEWDTSGGTGAIDTSSVITTVAMVCDSMVAKINADDSLALHVLAITIGDTNYYIGSIDTGLIFYARAYGSSDTSDHLTADSLHSDSIHFDNVGTGVTRDTGTYTFGLTEGYNVLQSKVVIHPALTPIAGVGNSDSGYIYMFVERAGEKDTIAQDSSAALPCSLEVQVLPAVGDTLLKDKIGVWWIVQDTFNDTTVTIEYPMSWDITLK